jgi:ABC-2 type transport system permease protein
MSALTGAPAGAAPGLGPAGWGGWGGRVGDTLHAEWTKLRTVSGPAWLLLATVAATVGVSTLAVAATRCGPGLGCPADPTKLSLTGVQAGQALAAVLGVQLVSTEYGTGLIRGTLTAMPWRATVLAVKAALLTALMLAAGAAAAGGSLLAGALVLPGHGFTAARGFAPLSLAQGPVLRATAGSVLYLALVALLSLGVATAVRDAAAAIGIVLGLLYLFPLMAQVVSDPHWHRHLEQAGPATAGLAIQATVGLRSLPVSPWAGLGVLAAWAAAALLLGGLVLRFRDV